MGSFKLGTMTIGSIFKKPETVLYPLVEKTAPDGLKGHIENDIDVCILSGICQKTCPAGALRVEKGERLWAIDRFACVQCGACTRACPKKCLSMEPTYQKPQTAKTEYVLYKPEETEEEKAAKAAKKAAKLEETRTAGDAASKQDSTE